MKIIPIALLIFISLLSASEHTDEATALKQSYLKNNRYIEEIPHSVNGKAYEVHKSLSSHFSLTGASSVKGHVEIDNLNGLLRLVVASSSNLNYQHKKVKASVAISLTEGKLEIYNPVDIDFWTMARLFINHPDRVKPEGRDWKLKGYVVKAVDSSAPLSTQVELMPIGSDYMLILYTEGAKGISIDLK